MIVVSQVINGLILGTLYILMAMGLSLIFGTLGVINFAHGALFALGAYLALKTAMLTNFWVGIIVGPVLVGVIGMVIQRFLLRPLQGKNELYGLLLTFGLAYVIEDLIKIVWGVSGHPFNKPESLMGTFSIGSIGFEKYRIFVLIVTAFLLVLLFLFLNKTRFGLMIRAGSRDLVMVSLLGSRVNTVFTVVFGIGSMLAGAAGALAAPMWGVTPTMGSNMLIPAFVVVTLGGMGSLLGATVGGLIIGVSVSLSILVWPTISDLIMYIIMAIVLLTRPRGLFGEVWEAYE